MEMEALDDLERLRAVKSSAALLCSACSPRPSRVQVSNQIPPAANKVNRTTRHGRVSVTVRVGVATRAAPLDRSWVGPGAGPVAALVRPCTVGVGHGASSGIAWVRA